MKNNRFELSEQKISVGEMEQIEFLSKKMKKT